MQAEVSRHRTLSTCMLAIPSCTRSDLRINKEGSKKKDPIALPVNTQNYTIKKEDKMQFLEVKICPSY